MEIHETDCCAVSELGHISEETGPSEIIRRVCEDLTESSAYGYWDATKGTWIKPPKSTKFISKPSAFYIFTGVEKVIKLKDNVDRFGFEYEVPIKYGSRLASYIKRHKLGTVTVAPLKPNRRNHPDHLVRVWVWTPSEFGLQKWWAKHVKSLG